MLVMPSNNSKAIVHYWAGLGYPIGWLFTPEGGQVREPLPWMPYAVDNGRFSVWSKGHMWNETDFLAMLDHYNEAIIKPLWAVVPDCVGDRDETLREWERWFPVLSKSYDLNWAFCVQDGMSPSDVPTEASVIFVGGTAVWKLRTLEMWASSFNRIHVGAVNSFRILMLCKELGIESTDGTGWFRSPQRTDSLERFFKVQSGEIKIPKQIEFAYENA